MYEKTDKLDEALEDYKLVLEKDSSVKQAREATLVSCRLPPANTTMSAFAVCSPKSRAGRSLTLCDHAPRHFVSVLLCTCSLMGTE